MWPIYPRVKPTIILQNVTDIDLDVLENNGIKGIIFDLDNTLMVPKSGILRNDIQQWLDNVRKKFKIAVVSNNRNTNYIKHVEQIMQCPTFGSAWKPRRTYLRIAAESLELQHMEIVIVGDRPLTDIWSGQRAGMQTILVDPLTKNIEPIPLKILRKIERSFVIPPILNNES